MLLGVRLLTLLCRRLLLLLQKPIIVFTFISLVDRDSQVMEEIARSCSPMIPESNREEERTNKRHSGVPTRESTPTNDDLMAQFKANQENQLKEIMRQKKELEEAQRREFEEKKRSEQAAAAASLVKAKEPICQACDMVCCFFFLSFTGALLNYSHNKSKYKSLCSHLEVSLQ